MVPLRLVGLMFSDQLTDGIGGIQLFDMEYHGHIGIDVTQEIDLVRIKGFRQQFDASKPIEALTHLKGVAFGEGDFIAPVLVMNGLFRRVGA